MINSWPTDNVKLYYCKRLTITLPGNITYYTNAVEHTINYLLSISVNIPWMWLKTRIILWWLTQRKVIRGNYPEVLLTKGVLKICSKSTGEQQCESVISINLLCNFIDWLTNIKNQNKCWFVLFSKKLYIPFDKYRWL